MTEDELLARYGTQPTEAELVDIRALLARFTAEGPDADTTVGRLLCVLLFNAGSLDDVLAVWRAKESSFDASCSIDVQLLCGAGLNETKRYLVASAQPEAKPALDYLRICEDSGDFEGFTPAARSDDYNRYYRISDS